MLPPSWQSDARSRDGGAGCPVSGFGLAQHKGYPTPVHLEALNRLGVTPEHRRSFRPVKMALDAVGVYGGSSAPVQELNYPADLFENID